MQDGSSRDGTIEPEEEAWSEFLRSEMDSWYPAGLPAHFRPRERRRRWTAWFAWPGSALRLAAIAILLALLAALALSSLPRQVSDRVVSLGHSHPASTPTSVTDRGTPRSYHRGEATDGSLVPAAPPPGASTWPAAVGGRPAAAATSAPAPLPGT